LFRLEPREIASPRIGVASDLVVTPGFSESKFALSKGCGAIVPHPASTIAATGSIATNRL
jgi:hypothetical protein